jgi:large subunit ribosomal protein L13
MKTTLIRDEDARRTWYLVDAADKTVGRLAVKIASILRGRTKPTFAPQSDIGDFVVVINADKVRFTGSKEEQKIYTRFSGYPGGLKRIPARIMRQQHPDYIITHAVKGMLPKNHLARRIISRLKVYAGAEHPHAAQKPQVLEV